MSSIFTRAAVKKLFKDNDIEVPNDVMTELFELHTESNQSLKDELDTVTKERDDLKDQKPVNAKETEEYKTLQKEFEDYKKTVADEKTNSAKTKACIKALVEAGVSESTAKLIVNGRDFDLSKIEMDGEKFKDSDATTKQLKETYADYIPTKETKGQQVPNGGNGKAATGKMTKEEILAIKDLDEQQKAIADNWELFKK